MTYKVYITNHAYLPIPESLQQTSDEYCLKADVGVSLLTSFVPMSGMYIGPVTDVWQIRKVSYAHDLKTHNFFVETEPTIFTPLEQKYRDAKSIDSLRDYLRKFSPQGWERDSEVSVTIKIVKKEYVPEDFSIKIEEFKENENSFSKKFIKDFIKIRDG